MRVSPTKPSADALRLLADVRDLTRQLEQVLIRDAQLQTRDDDSAPARHSLLPLTAGTHLEGARVRIANNTLKDRSRHRTGLVTGPAPGRPQGFWSVRRDDGGVSVRKYTNLVLLDES